MLPPATLFAVGFVLCPFAAFTPSGRNLTALLPEICDLLGSLYCYVVDEFVLPAVAILRQQWRTQEKIGGWAYYNKNVAPRIFLQNK